MSVTMESAVCMGKSYLNNCHSIANTTDLTLKQMFDISTILVSEQDEISGLETIGWENHSWNYLSLIGDERVINLQRAKVYVFSDSVLCLGKIFENTQSNDAREQRLGWFKSSQNYRNFDRIDASQWNSSGIFSQDSIRCRSVKKSNVYCWDWMRHQRISQEESYLCRCSTTFPVDQKTMKKNAWRMPNSFLCMQKDLEKDNGNLLYWSWFWKEVVLYQWRQFTRSMGQYGWKDVVGIRKKWLSNFPRYESIVQRSTQKQRTRKTVDALCSRFGNDWNYFCTIVSANQLSPHGAVAEMCEEYETFHDRTVKPVVMGQSSSSLVLSVIEKLTQQDKLSKFCVDAGFLNIVEIGQYFMTKGTA